MTIDLTAFAARPDQDTGRYDLLTPWREGEWLYATDGRIAVRVLAPPDAPEPDSGRRVPSIAYLFGPPDWPDGQAFVPPGTTMEWPEKTEECDTCRGTGRGGTCHECDGSGRVTCSACEQEHDCPDCDGTGKRGDATAPCSDCAGTGREVVRPALYRMNGAIIQSRYADMIRALPGVGVCPCPQDSCRLNFVFDGGHGAVMGYTYAPED